jgi:hypothetical protein
MGTKTLDALVKFQSDNKLPIGKQLNLETVKALGVDYERKK